MWVVHRCVLKSSRATCTTWGLADELHRFGFPTAMVSESAKQFGTPKGL